MSLLEGNTTQINKNMLPGWSKPAGREADWWMCGCASADENEAQGAPGPLTRGQKLAAVYRLYRVSSHVQKAFWWRSDDTC